MIPPPWRLETHEALPSTQESCRAAAEAGAPAGLAILAGRQTAGRGTQGRGWQSPPGNLALSVLLRPEGPPAPWSLLAAVALAEALAACLPPDAPPALKWPNDVLLPGGKVAGILAETAGGADGRAAWLVLGFGVNLAHAPPVPGRRTAAVADHAPPPAPEPFARRLLALLDHWLAAPGPDAVLAAWCAYGPPPGTRMRLRVADGPPVDGHFAGLGPDGALLLATAAGTRAFASGALEEPAPCFS